LTKFFFELQKKKKLEIDSCGQQNGRYLYLYCLRFECGIFVSPKNVELENPLLNPKIDNFETQILSKISNLDHSHLMKMQFLTILCMPEFKFGQFEGVNFLKINFGSSNVDVCIFDNFI